MDLNKLDVNDEYYVELYSSLNKYDLVQLYQITENYNRKYGVLFNDTIFSSKLENFKKKLYDKVKINEEYIELQVKKLKSLRKTKSKYCFKDYNIINYLSQGYFGKTYLVERKKKYYVIKVINLLQYIDPSVNRKYVITDIENEVKNQKILASKNITPKIYDSYICYYNDAPSVFIVMEYMNMGTLWDYLIKGNELTKDMERQLKSKIKIMHNLNILHNDLHEENILLNKNEEGKIEVFISDLGLSQSLDNMKMLNIPDIFKDTSRYKEELIKKAIIYKMIFN